MSTTEARTARAITELKTAYFWSINQATEAGRSGLVQELTDAYQCEAREIVAQRQAA